MPRGCSASQKCEQPSQKPTLILAPASVMLTEKSISNLGWRNHRELVVGASRVFYSPLALADLDAIYDIAGSDFPQRGFGFVRAI